MVVCSRILDKAVEQSMKCHDFRHKHGCVVFVDNNILSVGYNKIKRLAILNKYGYDSCSLHAELDAILKVDRELLRKAEIIVVRFGLTKLKNSKPCSTCLSVISEVGIKKVHYSDELGIIRTISL